MASQILPATSLLGPELAENNRGEWFNYRTLRQPPKPAHSAAPTRLFVAAPSAVAPAQGGMAEWPKVRRDGRNMRFARHVNYISTQIVPNATILPSFSCNDDCVYSVPQEAGAACAAGFSAAQALVWTQVIERV